MLLEEACCLALFGARCILRFFGVVFLVARFSSNHDNLGGPAMLLPMPMLLPLLLLLPVVLLLLLLSPSPTNDNHAAPDCFPKLTARSTNAETSASSLLRQISSRWFIGGGVKLAASAAVASVVDVLTGFGLGRLRGISIVLGSRFGLCATADTSVDTRDIFARLAFPGLINGFRGPPISVLDCARGSAVMEDDFFLLLKLLVALLIRLV